MFICHLRGEEDGQTDGRGGHVQPELLEQGEVEEDGDVTLYQVVNLKHTTTQMVYNTKGTRAQKHRESIREWLWEPKATHRTDNIIESMHACIWNYVGMFVCKSRMYVKMHICIEQGEVEEDCYVTLYQVVNLNQDNGTQTLKHRKRHICGLCVPRRRRRVVPLRLRLKRESELQAVSCVLTHRDSIIESMHVSMYGSM